VNWLWTLAWIEANFWRVFKRSLRIYRAAIVIFCKEHEGKSMLALSRDLGLSYKAAFVLCHVALTKPIALLRRRFQNHQPMRWPD
jgi:hypothetical protein